MAKHAHRNRRAIRIRVAASVGGVVGFVSLVGGAWGLAGEPTNLNGGALSRAVLDPAPVSPSSQPPPTSSASATSPSSALSARATVEPDASTTAAAVRARPKPQKIRRAGKPFAVKVEKPKVFSFRIGSFNILGSQHTQGKGGLGPGTARAAKSAGLIESRGVDIVGLQEVQRDQLRVLDSQLGGYDIWPRDALGNQGYRHQIAWRSSRFEMVDGSSVAYPFDNQRIPLPYVLLRDRATGGEFYVIDTHNSARNLEGERDEATGIQINLINSLKATGRAVFIVGDMNEHTEYFCRVAGATGMVAANGGGYGGGCQLPPRPLRVDWIMGVGGVDFSNYVQDNASRSSGASDHYFIYGNATVTDAPDSGDAAG